MSNDQPPLPDTTKWQPRKSASEALKSAFLRRCLGIEKLICLRARLEREMNIDNFDSGLGVEDIIRSELEQILPTRYSVKAGVINDKNGNTAGDFDVVIFNEHWFPLVKAGATAESRRIHLPIDGVYAVCEIKQTLDFQALDRAMEKLAICHRLHRPQTRANRIVENRENSDCLHGLTNPLYSAVIATDIKESVELDLIVERFFKINQTLERLAVVRALCVFKHGTVTWGFKDDNGECKIALFMREDLDRPIVPIYHKVPKVESALYCLMADILCHLYHSVLAPEDIVAHYGPLENSCSIPSSPDIALPPDSKWLSSLNQRSGTEGESIQFPDSNDKSRKAPRKPKTRKHRGFG
ncbi:MAG: hypothetical protein EBE86_023790 [Hormoscilla sp. GUM202]|nr:hypothetical protein [Hormoscilla sp. GUM202]